MKSCRFWAITLLGTLLLQSTTVAQDQGCFELQPPSCDSNNSSSAEHNISAQDVCFTLEIDYLYLSDDVANLSTHQAILNSIPADSELCRQARLVYHECYWCDLQSSCFEYDFGALCEPPNVTNTSVDTEAFCDYVYNELPFDQLPATKELCYQAEQSLYTCEFCRVAYLGADTEAKKKAIVWMSRVAAFLSLIGASYILWDVLRLPKNRKNVYHQLLLGMACFDVCTAVAWAFGTAPIPTADFWDEIYGVSGSYATCTAQAFFIQLGYSSVFYNVSLSCYYVLVIRYAWTETQLKSKLKYLHGVPLIIGFGLALGGIPIYGPSEYGCHITFWDQPIYIVCIFFAIPIGLSIILITAGMLSVYIKVRRQTRASNRYSLTSTINLERKVFWQCLSYGLAFYITWPIQYTVYLGDLDYRADKFGFTLVVAFVAPLQGFNNFLVYIRPRWQRYLEKRKSRLSMSSILFWRRESTECLTVESQGGQLKAEESSVSMEDEEEFEPSVRIAEQNLLKNHATNDGATGRTGFRMNEDSSDSDEVDNTMRTTNVVNHDDVVVGEVNSMQF